MYTLRAYILWREDGLPRDNTRKKLSKQPLAIFVFLATKSRGEFPPHIIWNEILTMFSPQVF